MTESRIPKWIADIFKTKKEKRSEQEQLDLDRYVADLRLSDPEKYERLQDILKYIDPDTGQLPVSLNTRGDLGENLASDLADAGFKTWEYTDENGRLYYPKGRNQKEAALWLRLKHKLKNIDVSKIELADNPGVGWADNTTLDIYNRKYQPDDVMESTLRKIVKELMADLPPTEKVSVMPGDDIKKQMIAAISTTNDPEVLKQLSLRFGGAGFKQGDDIRTMKSKLKPLMDQAGPTEYLKLGQVFKVDGDEIISVKQDIPYTGLGMKENKTKMNKKDLMEIIREVIAEEMGKVSIVLQATGGPRTIASLTSDEFNRIKDGVQYSGEQVKDMLIPFASIRNDEEMKNSINNSLDDNVRYQLDKFDNTLRLVAHQDVIPDNPYSHKKVTENKMKVNQLRQIIREEISKVLKENALGLSPEGEMLFNKWKAVKLKYNPELAAMSDEELLAMMREFERHEQEIDRRERLRDM